MPDDLEDRSRVVRDVDRPPPAPPPLQTSHTWSGPAAPHTRWSNARDFE